MLVTQGGVPVPVAHEISLRRYRSGLFGFSQKVEEVEDAPLQTVAPTPGTACGAVRSIEVRRGVQPRTVSRRSLQLKVELKIAGKK